MNSINPHFRSALPNLLEDICAAKLSIEHHLESARTAVAAALDYLDFEIEKASLAVDRLKWESQTPPEDLDAARQRLRLLQEGRNSFRAEDVMSSLALLDRITGYLGTLEVPEKDEGSSQE